MIANIKKTKVMLIGPRPALKNVEELGICLSSNKIDEVTTSDYLGLRIQNRLSWKVHIDRLCEHSYSKLKLLNWISGFLPIENLLGIYKQIILPMIDYCSILWHDCGSVLTERVEKIQNKAMRTILKVDRLTCTQNMHTRLGRLTLHSRRRVLRYTLVFKIVNNVDCPMHHKNYFLLRSALREKTLRGRMLIDLPKVTTFTGQTMLRFVAARDWNSLPMVIRHVKVLGRFKSSVF